MERKYLIKGLLVAVAMVCPSWVWGHDFSAVNDDGVTIYHGIVD